MSKGSKPSGSQTVTQSNTPWEAAQPALKNILADAKSVYESGAGSQYYPGSTYIPFSPASQAGMDMAEARAFTGSPLTAVGQNAIGQTASGMMLNSNPWLDSMFGHASDRVNSAVNSQFSSAGRYGSGAHAGVLADKNNELASRIYGDNYATERGRQVAAATIAPQMAQADYFDPQMLMQIGGMRQEDAAMQLSDAMNRWAFQQQNPWDRLGQYNAIVGGMGGLGGSSSQTTPLYKGSTAGNILGGASTGFGIGSQLGGTVLGMGAGPFGAIAGGLLGGLFG